MKISSEVEPLVREALTAMVKSDPERLRRAFLDFPNDNAMTAGAEIATTVSLYVLTDVYGRKPSHEEIVAVAEKLVEMEDWTDVTADEVVTFLTAAFDGNPMDQILPLDRIGPLAYLTAGNLLSSCCKDGEFWYNYLDRAEAAIEAATPS